MRATATYSQMLPRIITLASRPETRDRSSNNVILHCEDPSGVIQEPMVQVAIPPTSLQKGATYCALAVSVCCDELSVTYTYLLLYTRLLACDHRDETTTVQPCANSASHLCCKYV